MHIPRLHASALAVVLLLLSACRGASGVATSAEPSPVPLPAPVGPSTPAAIAQARADSAQHPYTAADIRFMTGMIGHHAQAIVMADLAPTRGASPAVRRLAERIINAQRDEIVTMQAWLADRNLPVPDARTAGAAGHADHGAHTLMPGMLTPPQLAGLEAARGADFDRLFLQFMLQHHRGALEMVQTLFGAHGAGQDETVFRFATDVNVDQETEIARMELMLAELVFGKP